MDKKRVDFLLIGVLAGLIISGAMALLLFGGVGGVRAALKYAAVLRVIRMEFVADYDVDEISDSAMEGAVAGLDDRWSYYMDKETYAAYRDVSANRYQGIGVAVSKEDETGGFCIKRVNRDGPAMQAGLVPGDIIIAVDGVDVTQGSMDDLRELIRADFGKNAVITVRREDGTEAEISVSCEEIYSTPVDSEMLPDGESGYIRIKNFRDGSAADAIEACDSLVAKGAKRLVFDVRNNPGGQLSELVELLDHLLPEGAIFIRADKHGNESVEFSDASCVDLPMAVIVNDESFSAAEFFAAAMQEFDWAEIVGEATTGKSRSQITVSLSDGSAVHLSKFRYMTPNRVDLYEAGGIIPDEEVALTEEERELFDTGWLEHADDPQLHAAVSAASDIAKFDELDA